jgi:hypothetical protein
MNDLQRKAAEIQLGVLKLQHKLLESQLKGDVPGHPFRGNQYSGGGGGGDTSGSREAATSKTREVESVSATLWQEHGDKPGWSSALEASSRAHNAARLNSEGAKPGLIQFQHEMAARNHRTTAKKLSENGDKELAKRHRDASKLHEEAGKLYTDLPGYYPHSQPQAGAGTHGTFRR